MRACSLLRLAMTLPWYSWGALTSTIITGSSICHMPSSNTETHKNRSQHVFYCRLCICLCVLIFFSMVVCYPLPKGHADLKHVQHFLFCFFEGEALFVCLFVFSMICLLYITSVLSWSKTIEIVKQTIFAPARSPVDSPPWKLDVPAKCVGDLKKNQRGIWEKVWVNGPEECYKADWNDQKKKNPRGSYFLCFGRGMGCGGDTKACGRVGWGVQRLVGGGGGLLNIPAEYKILRVSGQNGVSLLYIMLEIHHSGWEPSTSGTDLWRQTRAAKDRSRRSDIPSHPVTGYWHQANQSEHWPPNPRHLVSSNYNASFKSLVCWTDCEALEADALTTKLLKCQGTQKRNFELILQGFNL